MRDTEEILLKIQNIAINCAKDTYKKLEVGTTEKEACEMMNEYLKKYGITEYFHHPFAWFGDRTKFHEFSRPLPLLNKKFDLKLPSLKNPLPHFGLEFMPTDRALVKNEAVILDVAPIQGDHFADIGYSEYFGENEKFNKAKVFLETLKKEIPNIIRADRNIKRICRRVNDIIALAGYGNCHQLYPLSVLGHKVGNIPKIKLPNFKVLGFSPKAFTFLFSHNLTAPFYFNKETPYLTDSIDKDISNGFWAIEPHIGAQDFGLKFEEILRIDNDSIYWISQNN
jgi:hypothetical protein